jgi:hypothetical protein
MRMGAACAMTSLIAARLIYDSRCTVSRDTKGTCDGEHQLGRSGRAAARELVRHHWEARCRIGAGAGRTQCSYDVRSPRSTRMAARM